VLKTLGFSNVAALALVLAESVFVALLGGVLGLGLAWAFVLQGDPTNGALPTFALPPRDLWIGLALMLLLGVLAGALPAAQAMRLRIVDALRKN
jgi:putative ABC transport system permease protein